MRQSGSASAAGGRAGRRLDLADDASTPDVHHHVIDSSMLWERKHVDGLDLVVQWIVESLANAHAAEEADDVSGNVRMF